MREEFKKREECARAIEKIIAQNFDGFRLNTGIAEKIASEYGKETMLYVLANTVFDKRYDGRFSTENKQWALSMLEKTHFESPDRYVWWLVNTHPAVLDGFINAARNIGEG